MKITSIEFNWTIQGGQTETVGHQGVTETTEYRPKGEGDRWYYDVHREDGKVLRVFNISTVVFAP